MLRMSMAYLLIEEVLRVLQLASKLVQIYKQTCQSLEVEVYIRIEQFGLQVRAFEAEGCGSSFPSPKCHRQGGRDDPN